MFPHCFFPCSFWNVFLLLFSLFVLVLTQSLSKCYSWGIISLFPCILTSLFPHGVLVTLRGRHYIRLRCQSIWTRIFGGLLPEDSNLLQNIFFTTRYNTSPYVMPSRHFTSQECFLTAFFLVRFGTDPLSLQMLFLRNYIPLSLYFNVTFPTWCTSNLKGRAVYSSKMSVNLKQNIWRTHSRRQ
jgi:hypothetical protein